MADRFLQRRVNDPRFYCERVDASSRTAVTPWYLDGPSASPASYARKASSSSLIAVQDLAAKRKYYTSDSSGSDRETEGHKEGVIHRLPKGSSKKYYVYYKGKKITFGDPNMTIGRSDDKRRESFNARHKCAEKTDKTKAGYWACKVWKKGYRGPSSKKD